MANIFPEDATPWRILIIDDNPSVHEAFDEILNRGSSNPKLDQEEAFMFGTAAQPQVAKPAYATDHALSGAEGVEKVRAALAAQAPYQVAFVDIRMPGMDGVETIERAWQLDTQVQTVICTAYADYRWEQLAARLGQTDRLLVLKKPFHDVEVMQMASTLARKWMLAREAAMKMEQAERLVARRTESVLEFQRREHERIQELDRTKVRQLTQLAQEFRGPLTVMLQALEGPGAGPGGQETLLRNARALAGLVEDARLMRRLEVEDSEPEWRQTEVVAFMRGLVQMTGAGARARGVEIRFQAEESARVIWTDAAKLEKALFNLLARAVATAAAGNKITVALQTSAGAVQIRMDVPQPAGAFEDDIGCMLSREILRVLGGELTIEPVAEGAAKEARGLRVLVQFPADKPESAAESAPAAVAAAAAAAVAPAAAAVPAGEQADAPPPAEAPGERELPVILVIEGNADLRGFIRQGLGDAYAMLEADNAGQGLAMARENVPDLTVVGGDASRDDGVKICADLKHDPMTSHMPVILLATDDSEASRMRALEAGVNEFLTKPFRLPLLKACVGNVLENRRKLHEHFEHLQSIQPRELATNQMDVEFLRKVVEIVEKNLADYEFDVEKLARHLAVSRRQLFRKFKALAGCTPNVFIRDIRLKRAAQLLRDSPLTVSEIIYAVGFSDPKYFRTIFRERFGVLPGEYNRPAKAEV